MSPLCSLMIALKGTVYAVLLIAVVGIIKVKLLLWNPYRIQLAIDVHGRGHP